MLRFLITSIGSVSLMAFSPATLAEAAAAKPKPNVIVILADDLGYSDVGFNGGKDIPTPNIDRIAREGVRCPQAYVSHAVCSPSRAGLLTGRYQQRFGHERNHVGSTRDEHLGLPTGEILLPALLRKAGYVSGQVGKWHLGAHPKFQPMSRGFDEEYVMLGGGHDYFKANPQADPSNYTGPILHNGQPEVFEGYLTDVLTEQASAFIHRHADRSFFLYLAYNAPHTPLQAPAAYLARFASIEDKDRRAFAAMTSAMDDGVGKVLAALAEEGLDERTIVVFLSDNGGPTAFGATNRPFRAGKASPFEGGNRVPFAVRWTGTLPAGTSYQPPVISLDIFATAAALAGVPLPGDRVYDGVDLIPFLTGRRSDIPHPVLFWREEGRLRAMRGGDFKIAELHGGPPMLFDLAADPGETRDLAAERPEQVQAMLRDYAAWNAQLVKPLWDSPPKPKASKSGDDTRAQEAAVAREVTP